jgi:hypothetical protein
MQNKPGIRRGREESGIIQAAGCGDSHIGLDAKGWAARMPYDDGRPRLALVERLETSDMELSAKAQELIDKAQAVIGRKGIDEALASEMSMVRISEYGRLEGIHVRKDGKEMDAVSALSECLDKMTTYMAGLPPW